MKQIKIKTPAKINLTLEILNKRSDGFHNIQSIMQTVNLYDFLTVKIIPATDILIKLSGNSTEIPYNENNLVYKAAVKFIEKIQIKNAEVQINIEKNIPVSAGLAGGSTNAAGTFFALNKLFDNNLNKSELNQLCSELGSDLNFCLNGGCALCTSRGEIIEPLPAYIQNISLIKPKNLGISAKEAYTKFSQLTDKSYPDNTTKLKELLLKGEFDKRLLYNSLENALFIDYEELRNIKKRVKGSLMSGSGSTFFVLESTIQTKLDNEKYEIFENLSTINTGIEEV